MSTSPEDRAWMEVRADALIANARAVQASVGAGVRLIPMVKADAYGLGVERTVDALATLDPIAFGVATAEEGIALRARLPEARLIVVSPLPPAAAEPALRAGLEVGISNVEGLQAVVAAASALGTTARIHLEIDTGMGRAGFDWRQVDSWGPLLEGLDAGSVNWVGAYTHLHSADEDLATVEEQWGRFEDTLDRLTLPEDLLVHLLNSAGAMRVPRHGYGAVRPGIWLYGGLVGDEGLVPEPVASVHARVVHLKDAEPGDTVGYGATHRAGDRARWATVSIGYGDGLPRALGNRGRALLRGASVPIVGRISMDVTVVDCSGVPDVSVGDVVTFIGSAGEETITVDEVARLAGTISYEVLTGFTPRLPRIWTGFDG